MLLYPTHSEINLFLRRWAVIGWLLLQCKSNSIAAECKLALFFDWLTFSATGTGGGGGGDNIMNIEPAVLVMYHNLKHHAATSITLLDFLIRIQVRPTSSLMCCMQNAGGEGKLDKYWLRYST